MNFMMMFMLIFIRRQAHAFLGMLQLQKLLMMFTMIFTVRYRWICRWLRALAVPALVGLAVILFYRRAGMVMGLRMPQNGTPPGGPPGGGGGGPSSHQQGRFVELFLRVPLIGPFSACWERPSWKGRGA